MQKRLKFIRGFTIIEVMIVLAIAGLILLIIFLVVPALQRNTRNYDRKDYSSQVYSALVTFYDNNGHYPGSLGNPTTPANQAEICTFLRSLPQVQNGAACTHDTNTYPGINGPQSADCLEIQAGNYTVCYQDWLTVDHGYIPPDDQISIMLAHWCNVAPNNDPSEPVTYAVAGNDTDTRRFAIWTPLENDDTPYCLQEYPN